FGAKGQNQQKNGNGWKYPEGAKPIKSLFQAHNYIISAARTPRGNCVKLRGLRQTKGFSYEVIGSDCNSGLDRRPGADTRRAGGFELHDEQHRWKINRSLEIPGTSRPDGERGKPVRFHTAI